MPFFKTPIIETTNKISFITTWEVPKQAEPELNCAVRVYQGEIENGIRMVRDQLKFSLVQYGYRSLYYRIKVCKDPYNSLMYRVEGTSFCKLKS